MTAAQKKPQNGKSRSAAGRRRFLKQCLMGGCGLALSAFTLSELIGEPGPAGLRIGFVNDAPADLWQWSREADWYERHGRLLTCRLCPHACILAENDRGFCRTRVVKNGRLHTMVYGNPCSVHIDPIEKKPLFHFLPGSAILSIATAGCNLRCLNCQNWQLSQAKPEELTHYDLPPAQVAQLASDRGLASIAYTYSEPLIFYEYTRDTATLARQRQLRNVLVTAGYIEEAPLVQLCAVSDAANIDLKGFSEPFYKKITGSRLAPVLRSLEVMRREGVWLEVTRLVVPTVSDDMEDIRAMCDWLAETLGPGTPLHLSRFHPAYKLQDLPPTPVETMERAHEAARGAGLQFVYLGNLPGTGRQHTVCPRCGSRVITRRGYTILDNLLQDGRCPCGEVIPGVFT